MIVVDSSVWIAQLRAQNSAAVVKLANIDAATRVIVGDLVLTEVLSGARDHAHAARLERSLRRFRVEAMLDDALAVSAARYFRLLRGQGITVRRTVDLLIATFCIERGHALLHQDRDFDLIARHLDLKLA